MSNFTISKIEAVHAKRSIYKLNNGNKCQFDLFEKEIIKRGHYEQELASIYSYFEDVADGKMLPKAKFKQLKRNKKDNIPEYEFRTKNLRVYAIKSKVGKIIIFGGYKSNQSKDLPKFRSVKSRYISSL